jgi:hydrophobic/amphiphilic exporter-1 (mainly G- bacteria), HAE1 family
VVASAGAVMGALMGAFSSFPVPDPPNFNLGRPETQVVPDRVRAAAAGVNPVTIRQMAQIAVDGQIIGDYRERGRSVDLTIVTDRPREQMRTEQLYDVPLATIRGGTVPLGSVANFIRTSAPQQINRVEEQPAISFNIQLPPGMTIQEAEHIVAEQVEGPLRAAGAIPPTVRVSFQGSADKLKAFLRSFVPGFILAAVIAFLLLASLFENFIYPLVIIMTVPFAMVGGFLGLAVLHQYDSQYVLDVLTMLGFVILIGTIINNPILIVHQALNFMNNHGMAPREAIAMSTRTRVRPIFMSVTTSVAGMTPLVIFGGAGSELYRGLGAVLIGGLLLSTIFTLFLTPTLMSLLLDLQRQVRSLLYRDPRQPTVKPPEPAAAPAPEELVVTRGA